MAKKTAIIQSTTKQPRNGDVEAISRMYFLEEFSVAVEWVAGSIDFIAVFGFLLLSYKFSDLAKHYDVIAFREIGRGFRFLFLSYLVPFIGVFLGYIVAGDVFEDWAIIFLTVPTTFCTVISFWYFFRAIKSIVVFTKIGEDPAL